MPPRVELRSLGLALLALASGTALAQEAVGSSEASNSRRGPPLRLSLETSVMVSDNLGATSPGKDAGALLRLGPGLSWATRGGRGQATVDYRLGLQRYVRTAQQGRAVQHALRASARGELLPQHVFADANASVGQQTRSAFGLQRLQSNANEADNQTQFSSLSGGVTFRGRLGGLALADLRQQLNLSRSREGSLGNRTAHSTQLRLSPLTQSALSWGLQLAYTQSSGGTAADNSGTSGRLTLGWRPDVDWLLGAYAGVERSTLRVAGGERGAIYGANVQWQPMQRTRLTLNADHRVLGDFYNASLDHRFARAALRLSSTRSLNEPGRVGASGAQTNYQVVARQLGGQTDDPLLLDQLVRERLAALGLQAEDLATSGFLTDRASVGETHTLAFSLQQTPRWLWGLTLSKSRTSRLSGVSSILGGDDLANSAFVDSEGLSLNTAYRITPLSTLTLVASLQRNAGENALLQRNELQSLLLSYAQRLSRQTNLSLQLRHSEFDSISRPYNENAVMATLQHQF